MHFIRDEIPPSDNLNPVNWNKLLINAQEMRMRGKRPSTSIHVSGSSRHDGLHSASFLKIQNFLLTQMADFVGDLVKSRIDKNHITPARLIHLTQLAADAF